MDSAHHLSSLDFIEKAIDSAVRAAKFRAFIEGQIADHNFYSLRRLATICSVNSRELLRQALVAHERAAR